jgi:hypothetical protein
VPLHHLLYRCPECGYDPVARDNHGARCHGCGARYNRGDLALVVTRRGDGGLRTGPAAELIDAIRAWEDKSPSGRGPDGRVDYSAAATFRRVVGQGVVHHGPYVAGFYEKFSSEVAGTLRLTDDRIEVDAEDGASFSWDLGEVRAVQTSSKSLQLNFREDGLFDFRFAEDSPRRWEEILHAGLQAAYGRSGRRVREFQPRVVAVPIE